MTYEPRFDIDLARGWKAEAWTGEVVEGLRNGRVEVKADDRFADTGNLYVEYACRGRDGLWRDSGIALPDGSHVWVFRLHGQVAVVITADLLRRVVRRQIRHGRIAEHPFGENPTKGALVPLSTLLALARQEAAA